MKLIRFRREGCDRWEIAFSQEHLNAKLNREMAEVIMPARPWWERLWLKVVPHHEIKCKVNEDHKMAGQIYYINTNQLD